MILVIRDELVCPPTWFASYRDLTLYCSIFLEKDIVIESPDPDPYYRWLRPRGGMDFIQDFVRPGSERGVRLDIKRRLDLEGSMIYPGPTIITDRIVIENVHRLIASVRSA